MTNYEKEMQNMTIEKYARILDDTTTVCNGKCAYYKKKECVEGHDLDKCFRGHKEWLEEEGKL